IPAREQSRRNPGVAQVGGYGLGNEPCPGGDNPIGVARVGLVVDHRDSAVAPAAAAGGLGRETPHVPYGGSARDQLLKLLPDAGIQRGVQLAPLSDGGGIFPAARQRAARDDQCRGAELSNQTSHPSNPPLVARPWSSPPLSGRSPPSTRPCAPAWPPGSRGAPGESRRSPGLGAREPGLAPARHSSGWP